MNVNISILQQTSNIAYGRSCIFFLQKKHGLQQLVSWAPRFTSLVFLENETITADLDVPVISKVMSGNLDFANYRVCFVSS